MKTDYFTTESLAFSNKSFFFFDFLPPVKHSWILLVKKAFVFIWGGGAGRDVRELIQLHCVD